MKMIRTIKEMKAEVKVLKLQGKTVGLVPTMGYLHEGHLSLVRESLKKVDVTIVSVFVNPTQFGPAEDFHEYPRNLERDSKILRDLGIEYLFCPDNEEIFPSGFRTFVEVQNLQNKLCGQSRPGHFRGVCTVVLKLFNIIQPDSAFFGQKDAQQSVILKKMVLDLNADVRIVTLPVVREEDGLALSSRNVNLGPEQRQSALSLYKSLQEAESMVEKGEQRTEPIIRRMKEIILSESGTEIDYVAMVDPSSLEPLEEIRSECLIALAVNVGKVRLIDNTLVRIEE